MSAPRASVAVVGGGVTGLTTAALLQAAGFQTTLYYDRLATRYLSRRCSPEDFPTTHAAASIVPHGVRSSSSARWIRISQRFFASLATAGNAGVGTQRHFEVFEETHPLPPYAALMPDLRPLRADGPSPGTPIRPGAATIGGWSFDAFFCQPLPYLRFLHELLLGLGGRLVAVQPGLRLVHLVGGTHSVIVNCTGTGSSAFLRGKVDDCPDGERSQPLLDPWPTRVVRGHWVRLEREGPLRLPGVGLLSYNYTPDVSVYPNGRGGAADVYCYPTAGAWVLGGSRQERLDGPEGARWVGDDVVDHLVLTDPHGHDVAVPRPVVELNDQLLSVLTDGRESIISELHDHPERFRFGVGQRFERGHPSESVRLEQSLVRSRGGAVQAVIHNYGHGGAGFTLSWGCASDVVDLVRRLSEEGWRVAAQAAPRPAAPSSWRRQFEAVLSVPAPAQR